jgi:serine-type D-Ala-D-Ala carboxypeptidase (penicillin-binding protein 5/6)
VVLDSGEDRFAASLRALRYGFVAYERRDLVVEGERYASIDVPYRREETVDLVDASPDVEREVEVVEDLPDSVRAGTALGEVVVKVDGKKVGETRLVAKKGYEKASLGQRVWYTVEGIFD